MSDSKEVPSDADGALVDRVVMPSLRDLRCHARAMLAAADAIQLAEAIEAGDRLKSYQSYVNWLREDRNGDLCVNQAIATMLFDLFEKKDKKALADVVRTATKSMLEL